MRYLIALHLIACGKAAESPDCEAYAQHATDLDDPAPGRRDSILAAERRACENGRISTTIVQCVNAASSRDELLACNGLGKAKPAPVARPTPDAAPAKGTNHVTMVGVRKAGNFQPIAPEGSRPADQQAWLDRIAKSIAGCETTETYVPHQIAMLVTFSPQAPTFYFEHVPPALASCLKRAVVLERQPTSVGNGPVDFLVDVGN